MVVRAFDENDARVQEEVLTNLYLWLSNLTPRMVEEKRGMVVTESGIPDVTKPFPPVNGLHNEVTSKTNSTVASTTKSSSSWDDDWRSTSKGTTTSFQATMSCPSVHLEWPPRASAAACCLDDFDPFANCPPRPSGLSGGSGISNNGTLGPPLNKNGPSITTGSLHGSTTSQNSLAYLKQCQGFPTSNVPRPENNRQRKREGEGSCFKHQPTHTKSGEPPLMDLLG
ncbi:hypothetical protein K1719_001501 [Acacia pycnantha]|nr:hypothetical protein K1719_001501 [Acacia pycnantha]